ncbi:MAG: ABC transporter ATP-binding protein [Acetobacteraceae bacterium]|nr:ABC transporter ATP-binding protein [Acetobacteraceae bacterium]MCX7684026.1 ABC transporter ATP-binding protein [Acetobacteraceae bacterium]MDW8398450.1 ABC transporter ATP-binding protein [Acetobacteraceae bacterium]
MSALAAREVVAGYEPGLPIVKGASLSVAGGEIVALLGPNGAGKSTLAKAMAGLVPVASGAVLLQGSDITAVPAHLRLKRGLGFVPQTENVFANLTVRENLELAASLAGLDRRAAREEMFGFFPDLARLARLEAGRLSGGQRQMLAVARALLAKPAALMLDEPSAGLSPRYVAEVFAMLARVRQAGVAILLVEQNVKAALELADRAVVLVDGTVRLDEPARPLLGDPRLPALFLGAREHA